MDLFPTAKREASLKKTKTKNTYRSWTESMHSNPNIIIAYTDGSLNKEINSTGCAFFILKLDEKRFWKLNTKTSIFSAELTAIFVALEFLYEKEEIEEINITVDSKSSLQAICNFKWDSHYLISKIIHLIPNHNSAGTRVKLNWIPSHAGIEGNKVVDHLAQESLTNPLNGYLNNELHISELLAMDKLATTRKP